ncbi:MAG: Fic family protein, partial [Saprospiraceae bacterium]
KSDSEELIRTILGSSYSHEIASLLFTHPYIKIKVFEEHGIAKRETASVYLKKLAASNVLRSEKVGRDIYYINHRLMDILSK